MTNSPRHFLPGKISAMRGRLTKPPRILYAALDAAQTAYFDGAIPAYQAADDALRTAAAGVATGDIAALGTALTAAQESLRALSAAHDALIAAQALLVADQETIEANLDADQVASNTRQTATQLFISVRRASLTGAALEALSARDTARGAAHAQEGEALGVALDEWNDALFAYRREQGSVSSEVDGATSAYDEAVLAAAVAQARGSDSSANAGDVLIALRTAGTRTTWALVGIAGSQDAEGDGAFEAIRSTLAARVDLSSAAAAYRDARLALDDADAAWWDGYGARQWGGTFADYNRWGFAHEAISWAVTNAITAGVGEGRFDPNGTVTRAQIVTFLYRLHNLLADTPPAAPPGSDTFSDVPSGHWADQAVGWAVATKMTAGVGEGRFDPNGTVTRAQIVTFLYRLHNLLVKG